MNTYLKTFFLQKVALGFIFLSALQQASAASLSMQEVKSMRSMIVASALERQQNPTQKYFYLPSKESTDLARIVESYIPSTYAQIMQGKYTIIASPTEGIVGFKKRPGKAPQRFLIVPPEVFYKKNSESIGIALSPHNKFLTAVHSSDDDCSFYQFAIEDPMLRRGYCFYNNYELNETQSLTAKELGTVIGINFEDAHPGIEFENCFFSAPSALDSRHFANDSAKSSIHKYYLGKNHLKELSNMYTITSTGAFISTCLAAQMKDVPIVPRFILIAAPICVALAASSETSKDMQVWRHIKAKGLSNLNQATRKKLKQQPDYFSKPENFRRWINR